MTCDSARGAEEELLQSPSAASSDGDSAKDLSTGKNPTKWHQVSSNWLLWLGIGAGSFLNSLQCPIELSLSVGAAFLFAWVFMVVTPKQLLGVGVEALIELYFREYMAIGEEKIPDKGPVIFVCGPHSNQFLDPVVVSRGTTRDIRYIIAAKSLRRRDVGWLFKYAEPVPVERQKDLKGKKGSGQVRLAGQRILGTGTKFTEEIGTKVGSSLVVPSQKRPLKVKKVLSDHEVELDHPCEKREDPCDYEILPPLNHEKMFSQVYDHLGGGGALGIFPEGGSHDRTELLPLKVGVCLMALGTMAKFPQTKVTLVPVGLNYFSQHKFNSS